MVTGAAPSAQPPTAGLGAGAYARRERDTHTADDAVCSFCSKYRK